MRMRYVFMVFILILTCNVGPSLAESLNITHRNFFRHRTLRVWQVRAIEDAVNDNESRIASLEEENNYKVFEIGEALQFIPESGATSELLKSAKRSFDLGVIQYSEGFFDRVDELCLWATRIKDIAYLAASDDADRLAAFELHVEILDWLLEKTTLRFNAGVVSEIDVSTARYHFLLAEILFEGFKAKTGQ